MPLLNQYSPSAHAISELKRKVELLETKIPLLCGQLNHSLLIVSTEPRDPGSTVVKCRVILEQIVKALYQKMQCNIPSRTHEELGGMLNNSIFSNHIPHRILLRMHAVRAFSNLGAHDKGPITISDAYDCLQDLIQVLEWYFNECDSSDNKCSDVADNKTILGLSDISKLRSKDNIIGICFIDSSAFFKDRSDKIEELIQLLQAESVRLICIWGRGGIGKTALVSKVCHELETGMLYTGRRPNRIHAEGLMYIDCRSGGQPISEQIFMNFSELMEEPYSKELMACMRDSHMSTAAKARLLLSKIKSRAYFLIVDNFESLLDEKDQILDPVFQEFVRLGLTTPNNLKFIVTSRRPPAMDISCMRFARMIYLDDGLPSDYSIELLKELDAEGELGLRDAREDLLARVSHACYGIPRALETIAGILASDRSLTLREVVNNSELFDERVLENLVSEHYQGISIDQKHILECLSVLNKPVPRAALEYLLSGFQPSIILEENLRQLVKSYFVTFRRSPETYHLHALDQDFIYKSIPEEGSEYCKSSLHRKAGEYWLSRCIGDEIKDLEWRLNACEQFLRGRCYDEASSLGEQIAEIMFAWGRYDSLLSLGEELNKVNKLGPRVLAHAVVIKFYRGELSRADAEELLHKELTRYQQLGDKESIALISVALGRMYTFCSRYIEGIANAEKALALSTDPYVRGHALALIGKILSLEGQYLKANESLGSSIAEFQRTGDQIRQIEYCCYQAEILSELERYTDMIETQDRIFDHLPIFLRAWTHWHRARGKRYLGLPEEANDNLELAITEFNKIPFEIGNMHAGVELASNMAALGKLDESRGLAEGQLDAFRRIDHRSGVAYALCALSKIYRLSGLIEEAVRAAKEGISIDEEIGNQRDLARNHRQLGLAYVARKDHAAGLRHLKEALAIFARIGIVPAQERVKRELEQISEIS